MKSREHLAEVEKYITILHETCTNWVKFKHQIGYWYRPLFELKYRLIGKISYRCITSMCNTNIINVTTYVLGFLQGNGMFNNTGNPKVPWMKEPTTLTIVKIQKDITGVWHMCKTGVNVLMLFVCGTKDSILC